MNIMRKLLVSGGSSNRASGSSNGNLNATGAVAVTEGTSAESSVTTTTGSNSNNSGAGSASVGGHQHYSTTALGLMHLHKLFAELIHPPEPLTQQEQEQRLYNMLPLFCKVFGNSPAGDLVEKFCDILTFCQMVSRLMVSEIRRRASNQSTEAASCAIAKFLEIESTEEQSDGWMLLTTVNLLSAGGPPLIEVMTSSSLPSTLVKCLYLFFDLPQQQNVDDLESPLCQFTPKERRILLQKVFVQVLVRLCSNATPAEELARKDDLTLLFSAITSWCPAHNTVWRKSAAEVLMTLSRHGLTSHSVVNYIHSKGCVALCVENMQRVQELSPLEIVEMFVTIFCFLKDSSDISQILLDDFRACQGYIFLSDFLLRLEQDSSQDACNALRNVVLLIASLTTCGYIELKPSTHAGTANSTLFQIPGFQMPHPSGRGASVRNIQAFQVLQSVFLKAQTAYLCNVVLDAISTVYHSDKANYFILEPQHTLSQLVEKVYLKQPQTQEKFFKLLEFIVFDVNYVPCKELISLSILLKSQSSIQCSIICLRTLLNILQYNNIFKDVFREVGLLEVLATCLHRYAALLKEAFPEGPTSSAKVSINEDDQTLGELTMEALTLLLSSNASNAAVFRETGGARCAHNLVPYSVCRLSALSMVQQLVLNVGGDDDMGTLLGLMHTAPVTALDLKSHILKSLFFVLRESHRTRTVFRKVGGFVYVMSVLVSMEGCLSSPPRSPWDTVDRKQLMALLRTVFNTLAMAMRFEPANARFFASEICHTSLTDTIRLLGCFTETSQLAAIDAFCPSNELVFHSIFTSGNYTDCIRSQNTDEKDDPCRAVPDTLIYVCLVARLLYDMALDAFDNNANQSSGLLKGQRGITSTHAGPLTLIPPVPEPVIVHPGVVMTLLHLIPSIECEEEPEMGKTLQLYITEVLRSLVRSERNQQVMCEAGLPSELLSLCTAALEFESHPLHVPVQYILERLSAQALEPRDLRSFLRLSSPLCCLPFDEIGTDSSGGKFEIRPANQRDGGPVPLTRVKTLVSMTTPRDCRLHGTAITPPFVEFDMSSEGFSCLFLPSIAPQSATGPQVVGVGMVGMGPDTSSVIGGIGTGDRVFPPQPGLSFSTWFCVDRFSDSSVDPHPVRLLTLIRNLNSNKVGEEGSPLVCLSLQLSPIDKSILVSTQEMPFKHSNLDQDATDGTKEEVCARIWSPELLQESQWHHLVVVLNRAVLKNSSLSVYLDSQHIKTQKLHYVSQNPGGGAANLTVASSVYGFIGTPPALRSTARLVWKQGPCHLLEEVLSPHSVSLIYQLGPSYVGSLQAPPIPVNNHKGASSGTIVSSVGVNTVVELAVAASSHQMSALVAEERVVFGLNASAVSVMTLARIRRVYTKTDCKAIAKMLGLSSHENATPIYILHNSAGHLGGPARSLGGVLIGYLGARVFVPRPVALTLQNVGGTSALLGLVAMAKDVEGLYAAVKALVCVAKSNIEAQHEMDTLHRYQTLAMLLKKKQDLLNSHILHLTFSLVGTVDSGRETTVIPNVQAFQDLLCNLEVWKEASGDLQKSLYEHFYELVTESCEQKANLQVLRQVEMVPRLLQILSNPSRLSQATIRILCNLLSALLQNTSRPQDILCFGQLCVATLPDPSEGLNEKDVILTQSTSMSISMHPASTPDTPKNVSGTNSFCSETSNTSAFGSGISEERLNLQSVIQLRNKCLQLLHALLFSINGSVNTPFCEEVVRVLGFDWFLLFAQPDLHPTTVKLALQLLTVLLMHSHLMQKFKDASQNGGWLKDTDAVLKNSQHSNLLLGFNVSGASSTSANNPPNLKSTIGGSFEIHKEAYQVSGFQQLQWLLSYHTQITELYFLLLAVMLGQPAQHIPTSNKLTLDSLWSYLASGVAASSVSGNSNASNSSSCSKGDGDDLCSEAAIVILAMIRAMLNPSAGRGQLPPDAPECPITLVQFLMFLYHNHPNFMLQCIVPDFLSALVLTLFPMKQPNLSVDDSTNTSLDEDFLMLPALSLDTHSGTGYNNGSYSVATGSGNGPAQKVIMDFIRVVVVDSFTLPIQGSKQPPVIDLVLEACPSYASHWHQSSFHTDLLHSVLEHLKSADTMFLMGEEYVGGGIGPLSVLGAKYTYIPSNIFYLTACLVDKMWQGTFVRDSHEVLDFIVKLLCQTKQKNFNVSLDPLFHSLNRTILFQLSRPMDNIQVMSSVLSCLQKTLSFQDLIFCLANTEADFLGCLSYCLFQLTQEAHITMESNSRSTWHISMPLERNFSSLLNLEEDKADLVKETAGKVWTVLYSAKRQQIEELYKLSGNSVSGTNSAGSGTGTFYGSTSISRSQMSNVHMARMLFHESSSKIWTSFLDNERKAGYGKELWQQHLQHTTAHTQLQSKLQKVTGGLTRLATRKMKKEPTVKPTLSNISMDKVAHWTQIHIAIVRDVVDLRAKHYQQTQQHLMKFVFEDWLQSESELTRERGLWGPPIGSCLDKWMLDMTEGPCRMRKKMVKNELFFIHYPYRPEMDTGENILGPSSIYMRALKYKVANCLDSKEYYKRWRPETMVEQDNVCPESSGIVSGCSDIIQQHELLSMDSTSSEEREIGFQGLRTSSMLPLRTPSQSSINRANSEWEELDLQETSVDGSGLSSGSGSNTCEPQEDNPDSQSVLRLLEDGEKISHMFRCARIQGLDTCEGLLLFGKEHCYVVDGFTLLKTREIRDIDSLPANMHDPIIPSSGPRNKHQKKTCSKFAYEDIKEVHKRRYLLQPIALEVFSTDGRNHLLSFPKKIRNKVYARFLSVATAITDNAQDSLAGQKRGASVESSANLLSNLIGETSVTQRWVRGEISNFQYLMHLNTLAGRSYNDLMQYPVFPWVLADYQSEELDLNNPETFRDLSKPLGAQTPDRLLQFRKRYKEWDDPHGETPPYHYGTFYSSAMIVASYLVRMEPFTQHFLRLQGGHFDLADRMFHSVGDAWMSASKHNMADIKELIPEFFYLPEFLLNKNRFDLGQKQNGVQLNDVVLPPWAKNDPREFIRVHRQALECDYVSSHLNEWIDLIFGFKQQGPAAVEAVNVFHHLFYEGNVDIYNIDDPLKKNATIGFINNFGQIPKQLFKKPHPMKKLSAANRVSGTSDPGPIMPGLSCSPDKLFFHNLDNLKPSMHPVKEVKGPVGQIIQIEKALLAVEQNKVLVQPNYNRYVAWGFADHSLRIGAYESERPLFVWEETPAGEILCCATPNEKTIITAGTNTMVTVWQFEKKKLSIKRNLYGHTEPVTCLTASRAFNLIVSGSRDHTCIIWDLSRLTFVRQLLGHPAPVAAIAVNDLTGDIASCAGTFLFVWTINGDLIASINTAMGRSDRTQQILCVAFSILNEWDNQNVVMTGASDGIVRMWSTDYVQVPQEETNVLKTTKISIANKEETATQSIVCETLPKNDSTDGVAKETREKSSSLDVPCSEKKGQEIVRRMSLADSDLKRGELFDQPGSSSLLSSVCRKLGSESSLSEEEEENLNGSDLSLHKSMSRDTFNIKSPSAQSRTNFLSIGSAESPNSSGNFLLQHSKSISGKLDAKSTFKSTQQTVVRSSTLSSNERPVGNANNQNQENGLRMSKSETSLADSFVVVTKTDALEATRELSRKEKPSQDGSKVLLQRRTKSQNQLRKGFVWQCQLVFRSKLTMHTAFDRKDNTDPAAVTALAVSRDHKTVYVGDSKGRVFSWSVTDHPGRAVADHWVRDEGGDCCLSCGVRFSFSERRHHCRNCGQLFCSKCSRFESEIARLRIIKPVRVCQMCYNALRASTPSGTNYSTFDQPELPSS